MSCGDAWGERVSALLDGELSPDEERDTVRHLSTCRACSAFRDRLLADQSAFLTVLGLAAGAAATAPVALPRKYAAAVAARRGWGRRESWYLATGLAAGLVVGLMLAYASRSSVAPTLATLVDVTGRVSVTNSGAAGVAVQSGLRVRPERVVSVAGAMPPEVVTGPASTATLRTPDGSTIELGERTRLALASADRLVLTAGRVTADLPVPRPPTEFAVTAGGYDFVALGTRYSVVVNQQGYWLVLERGHILVRRGALDLLSREADAGAPAAIYCVTPDGRAEDASQSSALPPDVLGVVGPRGQRTSAPGWLGR